MTECEPMIDIRNELDEVLKVLDDPHLLADFLETHAPEIRTALKLQGEAVAVYQFECDGSWVDCTKEHFEGHDGSEKRILYTHPPKPVVSDERVDVAFKAFHSFVPTNGGTTGFKQQLKAALEVALGVKS